MTDEDSGHREETARTIRESAIYLGSKAVPFLCNLLFIKYYTGAFTPETLGRYETILALALLISSLAVGWLQISLLRLYPRYRKEDRLAGLLCALWIGMGGSILFVGAAGVFLWFFRATDWGVFLSLDLLPWIGVLVLANSFFVIATTLLRAERQAFRFSLATASYSFLNLTAVYVLVFILGSFLLSLVAGSAIGLLLPSLAILFLRRRKTSMQEAPREGIRTIFGPLFAFGLPLSINQVASQLLNASDRYLILILLGDHEAGLYSVVYRIGDFAVRFVILSLMMAAYTSVTETYEERGREAAERLIASLSRLYLLLSLPLVAGLYQLQSEVVDLLAGPDYSESAFLLGWILLGNFLLGLSQYANFGLHLANRTMPLALLTLTAAALNLILNGWLLPIYGYPVAAYTTCLCFALLASATPFLANRHLTWTLPWLSLVRILFSCLAMVAVMEYIPLPQTTNLIRIVLLGSLGGFVYLFSLFAIRELSPADLRRLASNR